MNHPFYSADSRKPARLAALDAAGGLGGCMMILVRDDALPRLKRRLRELFYRPRRLPFGAHVCSSVAGAGLISV